MKAFLFFALLVLASPSFAQSLEEGISLFKQERYLEAEKIIRSHTGDSQLARTYLGMLILKDVISEKDKLFACTLFMDVVEKEDIPLAQTYNGYCFTGILGDKPENKRAYYWMNRGYQGGSREKTVIFGKVAYLVGEYEQSFKILKPFADHGDLLATRYIGLMYWHGHGRNKDVAKGCTYFEEASKTGKAKDLYNFGRCYWVGAGRKPNHEKANELISKALAKGYFDGIEVIISPTNLGGETPAEFALELEEAIERFEAKEYDVSYKTFKKFEDTGLLIVKKYLGYLYWIGLGDEEDSKKGCDYFEEVSKTGDAETISRLGKCYLEGGGRELDYHKAYELLKKASKAGFKGDLKLKASVAFLVGDYPAAFGAFSAGAEHGDPHAMVMLGVMYRDGLFVTQNHEVACDHFERALSSKMTTALYTYGSCLYSGLGRPLDKEKAYSYFKEAADLGDEKAKSVAEVVYKELYGK